MVRIDARAAIWRRVLATSALTGCMALSATAARAQDLPVGGTVVSGTASIATGGGGVTVTQTSERAIVNWSSFDVGAGRAVVFAQPGSGSATLNRVTGGTSSTIAGSITSNGAVYLINPNGIAITPSGGVATGGGFVASTLDIADADFDAGKLAFVGNGASARVSNKGTITAGAGAYVALLGGTVANRGTIAVPLGRVALSSGESVALDLSGDGFLRVAVPTAAIAGADAALIEMAGSIAAAGGRVELRAATVKDAVRNVINMGGGISADSATGDGGSIVLFGGDGGSVRATGTLSARATGAVGNGGFIETSGAQVDFTGLGVDATAANGRLGTWLIDPYNVTISTAADSNQSGFTATGNNSVINSTTLVNALRTANVTVQTGSSGTQAGNITLATGTPLTWTSGSTLTLQAAGNIALNSAITAKVGGLTLTPGGGAGNTGSATATAAIDVGTFTLTNGSWVQNSATLPGFRATDFRFDVNRAQFLRVTGGDGTSASPYRLTDVYGLQGMASNTLLGSSFLLANDIDASGTANWNAGAGFVPIGSYYTGPPDYAYVPFTGTFDGANHVIAGLTIARPGTEFIGLFGTVTGMIANVGLTDVSIQGSRFTAGLAAQLTDNGIVRNAYVTGAVSGTDVVALLVGQQQGGTITNAYVAGSASGSRPVGGLVAEQNGGTISNVYSTAAVSGTSYVGGLVGNQNYATISNAYASGPVSGSGNGLVGVQNGTISNAYWDTYSTGRTSPFTSTSSLHRSVSNVNSVTSDPGQSGAANYAYKASAYANLAAASGIGTANVTGFAFLPGDTTRPFLAFEVPTATSTATRNGALVIQTIHQVQLIGYDATRLAASYLLARDIDLTETGRATVGTPSSYAGMWAGTGFSPIGSTGGGNNFTGTFDGGGHVLNGLTINRTTDYVGLFGYVSGNATIRNIGLMGGSVRGGNTGTGALVGYQVNSSTINNVYAAVAVSGVNYVGGLVGFQSSGTITNAYATGAVSGASRVGGLVGIAYGTVSSVYASGAVSGASFVGGLIGRQFGALGNAYWDSYSTGQANAVGENADAGTVTNVSAVTSDPRQSGAANYAYKAGVYANLAAASGIGTATPTGFVFAPGNATRPFLAMEVPNAALSGTGANGALLVGSSHQLQLIGGYRTSYNGAVSGATLAGSYVLTGDIDLAETGRATVGDAASYSGMWAGTGFVPLGSDGAGNLWNGTTFVPVAYYDIGTPGTAPGFTGSLAGGGYTLSNLAIVRPTAQNVGLFGGSSGAISNLTLSGSVTGYVSTGGLIGVQQGGSVTGVTSAVNVTGSAGAAYVGGLVGFASGATIASSSASGVVSATGAAGGLVGLLYNSVLTNSASSATLTGKGGKSGGLVGIVERSTVTGGSSTGSVNGAAGGPRYGLLRDGGSYNGTTAP